jgi:hypothetical protein
MIEALWTNQILSLVQTCAERISKQKKWIQQTTIKSTAVALLRA